MERIEKAKLVLEAEQKLLKIAKHEVAAREERTNFLQEVLNQACNGDLGTTTDYTS